MNLIVRETEDYVVAFKESGLATVPVNASDVKPTLLNQLADWCPEVLSVCGRRLWEGGALHRLDTVTSGLVLFAKNQAFYDCMQMKQKNNLFVKTYIAKVTFSDGADRFLPEKITTFFKPYGPGRKAVKAVTDSKFLKNTKMYTTFFDFNGKDTVSCTIVNGFRHQIRCHLSYLNAPINGDSLYGSLSLPNNGKGIDLCCMKLSFPYNGETVVIEIPQSQVPHWARM